MTTKSSSADKQWHLSPTRLGQAYDIGSADGANIALVYGPADGGPPDFLRNASLIAAAPAMVGALYEALIYFEDREDINYEGTGPNAEMSIATEIRAALRLSKEI